jgi:hypothetical protein
VTMHELKVVPPYFESLLSGDKTFEVRRNDRGFQRGDTLLLIEYDPSLCKFGAACRDESCVAFGRTFKRAVTFVYSGDPRFGGVEPGFVVLGLGPVSS